jgi:hypothetical protein
MLKEMQGFVREDDMGASPGKILIPIFICRNILIHNETDEEKLGNAGTCGIVVVENKRISVSQKAPIRSSGRHPRSFPMRAAASNRFGSLSFGMSAEHFVGKRVGVGCRGQIRPG